MSAATKEEFGSEDVCTLTAVTIPSQKLPTVTLVLVRLVLRRLEHYLLKVVLAAALAGAQATLDDCRHGSVQIRYINKFSYSSSKYAKSLILNYFSFHILTV
jgi:hypothetical protein